MNIQTYALRMSAFFFSMGVASIICIANGLYRNEGIKILMGSTAVSSIFMFVVTTALYFYAKKTDR